jgi:hypothetical protein
MQIKLRVIEDNAVNDQKIKLRNNQYLRARNNADSSDLSVLKVNATDFAEFGVKPQSSFVPVANNDLTNVAWVKSYADGIRDLKDAVRTCSLTNINLAVMPANVDSVPMNVGERFAVIRQTTGTENGIYIFNGTGSAATRSLDANEDIEITQGLSFDTVEGLVNAKRRFLLTTPNPIVVGGTSLTFVAVPTGSELKQSKTQVFTLIAGDITNQYVDLANKTIDQSVQVFFTGVLQTQGTDYSLSIVGLITRVTFIGDLATGGAISLIATDKLTVCYEHEVVI